MNPSWRKPIGAFAIIALIIVWAALVGSLSNFVGDWPILVQAIFYLAAKTAAEINAGVPIAGASTPARPFKASAGNDALECLTSAIYYEAGNEPVDGQRAVAQVVLNRVRHPAFPSSICGVIYQGSERATGCQFTFTCDGSLSRGPARWAWDRAREVAKAALAGYVYAPVGNATHYHTNWIVPYWSASLVKSAIVGAHIFYRWSGGWGRPTAFTQDYSGREPNAAMLRNTAVRLAATRVPAVSGPASKDPLLKLVEVEKSAAVGRPRVTLRVESPRRRAVTIPAAPAYVERVQASDNLRWTLDGNGPAEKPLGREAEAPRSPAEEAL